MTLRAPLRLSETLAALSLATDLAMGQPPEKAIRSTVVACAVARHLGLRDADVGDVFYTTLLKHLGCTATTHEEISIFGPDELGVRRVAERTDESVGTELFGLLRTVGRGSGAARVGYVTRAVTSSRRFPRTVLPAICEVGARMAERLGLGDAVSLALSQVLERWDGRGVPGTRSREELSLATRIAEPATQAVIFHRVGGVEATRAMVEQRSGGWFDPHVARAMLAVAPDILRELDEVDPWTALLDAEPTPWRTIDDRDVGDVAEVFADMTDLKSVYTLGHSSAVADLAASAAEGLRLPDPSSVRLAGLLHDLGRVGVPTGVWEKPGALTTAEWEQVRLHPYLTERILQRSEALRPIARIAGMHHERHDASGYHRGSPSTEIPVEARLLGVADAFHAMTEDRPHRSARSVDDAAREIEDEVRAGLFDAECAQAVLGASGRPGHVRRSWPAGLSDREVEVLRLVARGLSNKEIAGRLVISPRTAEHHVQHAYGKIGVSTRAAAAVFAMEHGLLG